MDTTANPQEAQIQKFLDYLVTTKFFQQTDLIDDVKEKLRKDALERMNSFILEATLDEFSDEDVETFNKMVEEKKTPQELQQFAMDHITDYPEFMTDVLKEFEQIYLEG